MDSPSLISTHGRDLRERWKLRACLGIHTQEFLAGNPTPLPSRKSALWSLREAKVHLHPGPSLPQFGLGSQGRVEQDLISPSPKHLCPPFHASQLALFYHINPLPWKSQTAWNSAEAAAGGLPYCLLILSSLDRTPPSDTVGEAEYVHRAPLG